MLRQIDHVVVVVPELRAAVVDHEGRGFTVTAGGVHSGGVTHNALIGFADGSYLELIAFLDQDLGRAHRWWPVAERGGGYADFALLSDDLAGDAAALRDLVERPAAEGGRTRPDGVEIAWRSAFLAPPLPFLIEDLTDRALRVPTGPATRHANGVAGIARVRLGGRDPEALARRYRRLRERGAPEIDVERASRDGVIDIAYR